ncbi:MAG: biotin/lipoyl-binding protein [Candidatus Moranbacteria bacterium]|nr:biotin/lipoyl-binding protein [Candidatus Moranbacteria bacterium]
MQKIFGKGFLLEKIPLFLNKTKAKFLHFLSEKPWVGFFVLLCFLFLIIFTGHTLRAPEETLETPSLQPKPVTLFSNESPLLLTLPAQVKKDSVLQITALAPGIVSRVFVTPGQKVLAGQTLFSLTNDYGSGAASIEKNIAQNNAELAEEVSDLDKKIQSLEEVRIKKDDTLNKSNEAVSLERLQKEREIRRYTLVNSRLNLALALKNDAVFQPKSSLSGTVTSLLVRPGQFVNAGQALATFSANTDTLTLEVSLSPETAWLLDPNQKALLSLPEGDQELSLVYLSKEENSTGLYTAIFSVPNTKTSALVDNRYVDIRIPLKSKVASATLLPLESIYQDTDSAWVMTLKDGVARAQEVTLGTIYGNYIEITSGLNTESSVILTRGLIEGEAVIAQ